MQGIYTYIPETNYVPREYSVAAILLLLFTHYLPTLWATQGPVMGPLCLFFMSKYPY